MQIRKWIRLIVPGFLLAILMAVTISSSVLAQDCIDPVTKKVIPCPPGGGGGNKKPTPSPYPSFTLTSTNTPTATAAPAATITSSPTNTPAGFAVAKVDPGQPVPASFDKKNLFSPIVIVSLLVILIGLLLPGLRRGVGGSTKASPDAPRPGMGSGNGKNDQTIHKLTKDQIKNLLLIQGYFDALRKGQLGGFIKSDEVQRFLHDAKRGVFGGNVPDGTPGSKFPGTGEKDPFDVLDGLFHGPAFGLGRIDHSGAGGDPAQGDPDSPPITTPDGKRITTHTNPNGDVVTITSYPHGTIGIWTSHSNGTADDIVIGPDGRTDITHYANTGGSTERGVFVADSDRDTTTIVPGANAREVISIESHYRHGIPAVWVRTVWHRENSPGEDGHEANTDRNPLNNLDILGPRSLWEMSNALRHPGSDSEQHDPNTGEGGRSLTDAERERLGRVVPAVEVLDPNSGIDPLTGLHLDPNQMRHTHTEDDELDPNTGEQPMPGGG